MRMLPFDECYRCQASTVDENVKNSTIRKQNWSRCEFSCGAIVEHDCDGVGTVIKTCDATEHDGEGTLVDVITGCDHEHYRCNMDVTIMKETGERMADIRVWCDRCGQKFRFKGTKLGLSFYEPMASPDREELRVPIEVSDGTLGSKVKEVD